MEFLKAQFKGFSKFEIIFFLFVIILITAISLYLNDSKVALLSAICGICYTILAGKGRILCYYVAIIGNLCYCYLAFKNGFWGNLALWGLYYLPMEIIGIFKWKKHLNKKSGEIFKTSLKGKKTAVCFLIAFLLSGLLGFLLFFLKGKTPFLDGFTTVFSIFGQFFTLKRYIEQWYIWFLVDLVSFLMWLFAWQNGENCFAIVIMWGCYLFLAVYFFKLWHDEIKGYKLRS